IANSCIASSSPGQGALRTYRTSSTKETRGGSVPLLPGLKQRPETGLSARLPDDPDVGTRRLPAVGIGLLRFLVGNRAGDDHVVALLPVDRRRDFVPGGQLHR